MSDEQKVESVEKVEETKVEEKVEDKKEEVAEAPAAPAEEKKDEEKPAEEEEKAKKEEKKEPEPPKDPREDPIGWIGQQIPPAVHKVNFHVLDWAQKLAVAEEEKRQPLPGKNDAVTRNQFLAFLRDGTLLANLANTLQPGAIEKVNEGEDAKDKAKQTENIEAFANWAKQQGVPEDKVLTAADLLEKGKAGYPAVFETLWNLALNAKDKFAKDGVDVDAVVAAAGAAVRSSLIQTILGFFKRARPAAQSAKQAAMEAEEKEKAEKAAAAAEEPAQVVAEIVEEECAKVDAAPATSAAPAVAAN